MRSSGSRTPSARGTAREVEDYAVGLEGVTALELCVVPDVGGGAARASLAEWGDHRLSEPRARPGA